MTGYNTHRTESTKMHEAHSTTAVATTSSVSRSSPPTYDGIGAEEYIKWETKIDNIFAQCRMCAIGGRLRMPLVF
jgi:hypothetical protein